MSTILRAYGTNFDVDDFLVGCTLPICAVKRRGEPALPASALNGRRHQRSGVHVLVSNADFNELPRQVTESAAFLRQEADQIRRLCAWPGIEGVSLDFGIERRDVAVQSNELSAELVQAAGALGLGIEISQYPASNAMPEA
jgi:hypothetical protein